MADHEEIENADYKQTLSIYLSEKKNCFSGSYEFFEFEVLSNFYILMTV